LKSPPNPVSEEPAGIKSRPARSIAITHISGSRHGRPVRSPSRTFLVHGTTGPSDRHHVGGRLADVLDRINEQMWEYDAGA
jgi:hypothetical protein